MFPDLLEQQQKDLLKQDQHQQQEQDILETKNKIIYKSSQIESSNVKTPTLSDLFSQVAVLKSPKVYFKIVYSASKIR
jgi:hypothetical protein